MGGQFLFAFRGSIKAASEASRHLRKWVSQQAGSGAFILTEIKAEVGNTEIEAEIKLAVARDSSRSNSAAHFRPCFCSDLNLISFVVALFLKVESVGFY